MSIDRISYPLPVIVKGYACLSQPEVELANKDIDPARPADGPNGRDAPKAQDPGAPTAPIKADAAAPEQPPPMITYSSAAVRMTTADKATTYSVTA